MILYSNNCPLCRTLKDYLDTNGFKYEVCDDVDKMISMGFKDVPQLEIDGQIYDFNSALMKLKEIKESK